MVKTLFSERPSYDQIIAFRLEYHNLTHSYRTKVEIWKKCKVWTIDLPKGSAAKKDKSVDQGKEAMSSTIPID